jgi:hypothetical protein
LAIYLSKLAVHDYKLSCQKPSLLAVACLYVTLKIVEQLKKLVLLVPQTITRMIEVSGYAESEIIEVA